jgi:MoaA/NifB/PqqE/SkfB family radical SAM enzyme
MTATVYTVNLDYRCNERCVFCAADLGGVVPVEIRRPTLTLGRIREWLAGDVPGPGDRVVLSGGEPTLHRELVPIAASLAAGGPEVVLFTNGMRLADPELARAVTEAGVGRYEISLYGADAAAHDAMTRRPGSFDRTLEGLRNLVALRREFGIWIAVRLLVSRGTVAANPDIVRRVASDVGAVDSFSLNHLVLSQDALDADAQVSWAEARASVNECARLVRGLGYGLDASTVPLCVFDPDTIGPALEAAVRLHVAAGGTAAERFEYRYLDPLVPSDDPGPRTRAALPDVCVGCRLSNWCVRVERGYIHRFGVDGLRTVLPAPAGSG